MSMFSSFDPLYSLCGFVVGALVGMTGVGGGALMTPLLILLFGIHPATAVGTDLLYASATKTVGTAVHGVSRTVDWRVVGRLAMGSVPMTIITLGALSRLGTQSGAANTLITSVLASALFSTAAVLIFRKRIVARYSGYLAKIDPRKTRAMTIAMGALLGVVVSISSVGAGAIGVTALILLYPHLPMARVVGSDIAHAVPLTLIAGLGHWVLGLSDLGLLSSLLVGSIPGIIIGSYAAPRMPDAALRYLLAGTLLLVGGRLVF
ncbi:MAG TPA: sulfite exporter TauE/SafE family protein [Micropepsaceae bacterium]|nr:sulfite exporter TauE/SafE family protein [Micropepsaceae bacterium]